MIKTVDTAALTEKCILVKVSISQWTARKFDKNVTKEINDQHQTSDAGRFNKILIAENSLKEISKIANEARTLIYTKTLPWLDDGYRVCTTAIYLDLTQEIATIKDRYETAVNSFISNYPAYVQEARSRLNGMFNPADYPTTADLVKKFSFSVDFLPIPQAADFRIDLNEGEVARMRENLNEHLQNTVKATIDDIWNRLTTIIGHMADKLKDPDSIFRDSLIDNATEIVNLLPKLNFTNDPALEDIRQQIEAKLLTENADTLRGNKLVRHVVANEAQEILNNMAAYTGQV